MVAADGAWRLLFTRQKCQFVCRMGIDFMQLRSPVHWNPMEPDSFRVKIDTLGVGVNCCDRSLSVACCPFVPENTIRSIDFVYIVVLALQHRPFECKIIYLPIRMLQPPPNTTKNYNKLIESTFPNCFVWGWSWSRSDRWSHTADNVHFELNFNMFIWLHPNWIANTGDTQDPTTYTRL